MEKILQHSMTVFVSRVILGVIFVFASIEKISLPDIFAVNVEAYKLLPLPLINIFSILIPWIELFCGILLIAGARIKAASAIISGLLVMFMIAILIAMSRDLNIDCGCFGSAHATPVGWNKVVEDFGMLLLGLHLFFFSEGKTEATVR